MDGASFARAIRSKETTYPELAGPNPYGDLTVLACETGGRWHDTARTTVTRLLETKVHTVHPLLRRAARGAFHRRWWGFLSVALQRTVAQSLLDEPGMGEAPGPGPEPCLADVLSAAQEGPACSRLPMR